MSGGSRRVLRYLVPLLSLVVLVLSVAVISKQIGRARTVSDPAPRRRDAGIVAHDAGGLDASYRYDDRGRLARPPSSETYQCLRPAVDIAASDGCAAGRPYPECRWQLPTGSAVGDLYTVWRNTTPDHRWARPALIALVMAAAREYAARWPGEHMTIGDLDAAGPRHQTHDQGHDVDLYLEHAMLARNDGGGRYPDNYAGRSRREVNGLRARVMDLAKILATCAGGQIRIYYNDPDLVRPFREWFEASGMHSDVGNAMQMHNELHRFHFHLTVSDDLPVLDPAD